MSDFLVSLNRYSPKAGNNPTENFITESLCWILRNDDAFGRFFLEELGILEAEVLETAPELKWSTQVNWGGTFPDMVCEVTGWGVVIFENKTWTRLGRNQLRNYYQYARDPLGYEEDRIRVVVLTASRHQWPASSAYCHCRKCWRDVQQCIEKYLTKPAMNAAGEEREDNTVRRFLLVEFNELLVNHGLGVLAHFEAEELVGYRPDFLHRMHKLWESIHGSLVQWLPEALPEVAQQIDYELIFKGMEWGRIGIYVFAEWRPTVFVGVLLDPNDHREAYSNKALGPDAVVMLGFDRALHETVYTREPFHEFRRQWNGLPGLPEGWQTHDHHANPPGEEINNWHPLYIRKPLMLALGGKGAERIDDQALALESELKEVLKQVFQQTNLLSFREGYEADSAQRLDPYTLSVRITQYLWKHHEEQLDYCRRNTRNRAHHYVEVRFKAQPQFDRFELRPQDDGIVWRIIHHGQEIKDMRAFDLPDSILFMDPKPEFLGDSTALKFLMKPAYDFGKITGLLDQICAFIVPSALHPHGD